MTALGQKRWFPSPNNEDENDNLTILSPRKQFVLASDRVAGFDLRLHLHDVGFVREPQAAISPPSCRGRRRYGRRRAIPCSHSRRRRAGSQRGRQTVRGNACPSESAGRSVRRTSPCQMPRRPRDRRRESARSRATHARASSRRMCPAVFRSCWPSPVPGSAGSAPHGSTRLGVSRVRRTSASAASARVHRRQAGLSATRVSRRVSRAAPAAWRPGMPQRRRRRRRRWRLHLVAERVQQPAMSGCVDMEPATLLAPHTAPLARA